MCRSMSQMMWVMISLPQGKESQTHILDRPKNYMSRAGLLTCPTFDCRIGTVLFEEGEGLRRHIFGGEAVLLVDFLVGS